MEMTVRMPASYNLMTENEMTYTTGGASSESGSSVSTAQILEGIATGVLVINWIDMLLGARNWYSTNKTKDIGTNIEQGVNQWVSYTTSSVGNAIRSVAATAVSAFGVFSISGMAIPYGLIGTAAAFLTA